MDPGEKLQGGDDVGPVSGREFDAPNEQKQRERPLLAISKHKLQRLKEQSDKRGVIYISRIPPHMKPTKLRTLLEPFGAIARLYLAPEDPGLRRLRKKKKAGNSGRNFTEGWVEFEDKRRAKQAVLLLNGQPIGGKHRSAHHFDLWCLKYLPKFKWDHLTEQIRYDKAVREQKLVAELSAAKRERDFYLSRVDKAKALHAVEERRKRKGEGAEHAAGARDCQDVGTQVLKSEVLPANGGGGGDGNPGKTGDAGERARKRKAHGRGEEVAGTNKRIRTSLGDGNGVSGGGMGDGHHGGFEGEGKGAGTRLKGWDRLEYVQHGANINSVKGAGAPALPDGLLALVAPRKKAR